MSKSGSARLSKLTDDILEKIKQKTGCPKTLAIEKAVVHFWGTTAATKKKVPPGA